jgi:hypothetical protein
VRPCHYEPMPHLCFFNEAEIQHVGRGLLDRSLPKTEWTHAAHFAATLWLLRVHPELDLRQRLPGFIRAYNEKTGGVNNDTMGYHETITQASLRAAQDFLAQIEPTAPLHGIVNDLIRSSLGQPDWLLAYWSRERLFSTQARRAWLEPDLQPLPF